MSSLLGTINPNPRLKSQPEVHPTEAQGAGQDPNDLVATGSKDKSLSSEPSSSNDHDIAVDPAYLGQLARKITSQSIAYSTKSHLENPFLTTDENSPVNPNGSNFNPRAWLKLNLAIKSRDPDRYPTRTAGFTYRNLNVHGFGTPTDYQKDVATTILQVAGWARRVVGAGKQKIQILRNFDGIVRSGEMLMVLGRPGSGCSTLLKTIAGETHGLYVDDGSHLNYQGPFPPEVRAQ